MARHRAQQVLFLARRYGCLNEHNGWVPRDFWLEEWEKQAIVEFYQKNSLEGYRRLIEGDKFYTTYRGERLELPKDSGEGLAEYLRATAALDASP